MKCNSFILKFSIQFASINLNGSQKEGSHFLNLLQKEGTTWKRGGRGGPSEKAGSNPQENSDTMKTSNLFLIIFLYLYQTFSVGQLYHFTEWSPFEFWIYWGSYLKKPIAKIGYFALRKKEPNKILSS